MRIIIFGAGAVGAYYGGKLQAAGNELFYVARGEHLRAMLQNKLCIKSISGNMQLEVNAAESFPPLQADLIILATKIADGSAVLQQMAVQVSSSTIVMSLQNGVGSEQQMAKIIPKQNIVGGIAFIGTSLAGYGKVLHTASGSITIGELDGKKSNRLEKLRKMFEAAGIPCKVTSQIVKAKWEKLIWNCGFNGIAAISGKTTGQLLSMPETKKLIMQLMEETKLVGLAAGVPLADDIATKHIAVTEKLGEITPSMLQDIQAGKKTEVAELNGYLVKQGGLLGVHTIANQAILAAVTAMEHKP